MNEKPGFKSTEFWLTVVGSVVANVLPVIPQPYGIIVTGLMNAAYAISRGIAKRPVLPALPAR